MNFKGRKVLIRVKCMWQWVGYLNWKTCTSARLSSECLLSPLSFPKASNDTLTTALLIRRSLRRHSEDIISDADLMQNDILCLTETQLYLNEDTSDITTNFKTISQCITTLALINIEVLLLGIRVTYISVKVQFFVACHL